VGETDAGRDDADETARPADAELDALEGALDTVDATLAAMDADDLDAAETLAASLDAAGSVDVDDAPVPPPLKD